MGFREWRIENNYYPYQLMRENMIVRGHSEEDISTVWEDIKNEYTDYCDENGIDEDWNE